MGCCHVAPGIDHALSEEENACVGAEANLHYGRHKAAHIAELFKSNSAGGKVSENQFNTVVEALELNISELDTVDSPMFKFYRSLRAKGSFDLTKLLVLAAILGTGPTKEKVEVFFPSLPALDGGMATAASVEWLIDAIFAISIKSLPLLAEGENPIPNRVLTQEQLSAFLAKLAAGEAKAKAAAIAAILKGRPKVSSQDLVAAFDGTGPLGHFLKPLEIRAYVQRAEFK